MTDTQRQGNLFILATPIGNLEDLSLRAIRTLSEADIIAAEDTRRTRKLLSHLKISKKLVSYRQHNETQCTSKFIEILKNGESIVLVTDGGTPAISDPGAKLVAEAMQQSIRVIPVPGPSAVITSLSICGFLFDTFVFEGFLPVQQSRRKKRWMDLSLESRAVVLFEAPHRIQRLMSELATVMPERNLVVCRELTKQHESIFQGTPKNLESHPDILAPKGEFTIVLAPIAVITPATPDEPSAESLESLLQQKGSVRDIAASIAGKLGIPFRKAYKLVLERKSRS